MTLQSAVWRVARLATWIFYRVDRVGDPLPAGPLLLVANHPNGLLDPPLIVATSGRQARFLAKSTLFSMPLVGWFVRGAGAIPVYRRSDAGVDPSRNSEMFAAVERALDEGDAVCLFPEGTTHSRGRLDPLKTGAARIALGAAARGIPLRIVAAGINPDEKAVLRSNVTVAFGRPFSCDHLVPLFTRAPRAAVDALTAEIAAHIGRLVVEAEPIVEGELVTKIDRIYRAARKLDDDPEARLARRQLIAEQLLPALRRDRPDLHDQLVETVRRYDHRLARFGLTEGMVGGEVDARTVRRFAVRESVSLALLLPLLIAGSAAFAVPYFLIKGLSTRVLRISLEEQATYKVFGAVLFYPAWIALVASAVGHYEGVAWGWLTAAALPPLAVGTLFAVEREESVLDTVRSYFAWQRMSPSAARALLAQRHAIAETMDRLRTELTAPPAGCEARSESPSGRSKGHQPPAALPAGGGRDADPMEG
jgi:1-acyl-sn-glycerol-3-phosphate acyltransferase